MECQAHNHSNGDRSKERDDTTMVQPILRIFRPFNDLPFPAIGACVARHAGSFTENKTTNCSFLKR